MAEDDFGAHDDYQRELDEEAEFEQQRADAERRNAAENVAGITVLQAGIHLFGLAMEVQMCGFGASRYAHVRVRAGVCMCVPVQALSTLCVQSCVVPAACSEECDDPLHYMALCSAKLTSLVVLHTMSISVCKPASLRS